VSDQPARVNLNQATQESLIGLPGVGQALAVRIIARRPYASAEDLLEVPGIGPRLLERLRPYLVLDEAQPRAEAQAEGRSVSPAPDEGRAAQSGSRPGTTSVAVTRRFVLMTSLGTGLAGIILAVILTLAILAGINGTLSIERNESVRQLSRQAAAAESRLAELGSSIDSLETRLQAVEGLSGRMATLEQDFSAVREAMDSTHTAVEELKSSVSSLSDQVGSLETRVSVFDAFLRGIQRILQEILPQQPMEVVP
jgi:competence ComEA-like helix-hairpin-helix protein